MHPVVTALSENCTERRSVIFRFQVYHAATDRAIGLEIQPFILHKLHKLYSHLCPVRALANWSSELKASLNTPTIQGYIFRKFLTGDRISVENLPMVSQFSNKHRRFFKPLLTKILDGRTIPRVVPKQPTWYRHWSCTIWNSFVPTWRVSVASSWTEVAVEKDLRVGRVESGVYPLDYCQVLNFFKRRATYQTRGLLQSRH